MYQAPPPPIPNKPTPWVLIIAILGIGFLAVIGLIIGAGYMVYSKYSDPPQARQGFGKPVVEQRLADGWARYRFAEIPMSMEMPELPVADTLHFAPGDSFSIKEWAYYGCSSDWNGIEILSHWFVEDNSYTPEQEQEYIEWYLNDPGRTSNLKTSYKRAKYGPYDGYEFEGSFTEDGDKMQFFGMVVNREKQAVNLFCYYYPQNKAEAEREFRRMVGSMQFDSSMRR